MQSLLQRKAEDKLSSMSHHDERLQYYTLLVGGESGTGSLYGNHQTLHNLLPGPSVRTYSLKRQFGYEMTEWNTDSDGLYQGIKVFASAGTTLKAPFKCKISGFSKGDTINEEQDFAETTTGNVNFHINIDTDGYGWDYIDPRLVLY